MKKLVILSGLLLVSAVFLVSSCKKVVDETPSISFVSGEGYITSDATLNVSTAFNVKVQCDANTASGALIKSLNITRTTSDQVIFDTTFAYDNESVLLEASFISLPIPATETLAFKATDANNESASVKLNITTVNN